MTAPDNPVPLKSVKPEEWPERLYGGKAVVRFPSGVESGNWYSKPDAGGDQTREYIRADVAHADALAEVQRLREESAERHALHLEQVRITSEWIAERDAALARVEKLREALTPSGDTKATYMGEFSFMIADFDENGEEMDRKVYVPWDQIKEIMAAILARAALDEDAK